MRCEVGYGNQYVRESTGLGNWDRRSLIRTCALAVRHGVSMSVPSGRVSFLHEFIHSVYAFLVLILVSVCGIAGGSRVAVPNNAATHCALPGDCEWSRWVRVRLCFWGGAGERGVSVASFELSFGVCTLCLVYPHARAARSAGGSSFLMLSAQFCATRSCSSTFPLGVPRW